MAMARCSSTAALIVFVFAVALISCTVSGQETGGCLVGDDAQWNSPGFNYQAWADGYAFQVGDELIFQYNQGEQNVVVADSPESFDQCQMSPNYGVYDSGYDKLWLNNPGYYYFMSSYNCGQNNMKFYVNAI